MEGKIQSFNSVKIRKNQLTLDLKNKFFLFLKQTSNAKPLLDQNMQTLNKWI